MQEPPLKPSSQRVKDYLQAHGASSAITTLPSACRTSAQAADALGCSIAQIAKSLIFRDTRDDSPVLIVASGVNRVDVARVEAELGVALGKANARFVKESVGFVIGGVAPVGHLVPVTTVLDPDLKQYQTIWAAAGTPETVFALSPDELGRLTAGRWITLAERTD